ncbi:unnamed protein product [Linum trigynum]|uniref:Uncharacterized protein n=1 Tax=Linum trigynum TaxID=586398 RepID=A0AAV2EBB0_9ROSI
MPPHLMGCPKSTKTQCYMYIEGSQECHHDLGIEGRTFLLLLMSGVGTRPLRLPHQYRRQLLTNNEVPKLELTQREVVPIKT